eukprot:3619989-Lingulodinium_polyedra.AAC.1
MLSVWITPSAIEARFTKPLHPLTGTSEQLMKRCGSRVDSTMARRKLSTKTPEIAAERTPVGVKHLAD